MRILVLAFACLICTESITAQTVGRFVPTSNMTTPRSGHTATLLLNGKVLIAGGVIRTGDRLVALAAAELFDPRTGMFTATGNMMSPRNGHSATLLPDGRVLMAGGFNSGNRVATAELYDPLTGTFAQTGIMVTPQVLHTATLLASGKVLITGGDSGGDRRVAKPELYDPLTGLFVPTGEYAETGSRQNPHALSGEFGMVNSRATLLANGKVLIPGEPFAEVYDPSTETFRLSGVMTTRDCGYGCRPWYLWGRTATLLTNSKVLLAGGFYEDSGPFADAELYDPSTGHFTAIGNLTIPRMAHTATLLRDETVLMAGTYGASASSELYDPHTGRFATVADMISPRYAHTATLLLDGRVLLAGGSILNSDRISEVTSDTAELYVPSRLIPASAVSDLRFDRMTVSAGSSYTANIAGSNLSPQTFFDVRFTAPDSYTDVVLNWQNGPLATHHVPAGTATGTWTITGVRAHEIETDHTGSFTPVSATITVSP